MQSNVQIGASRMASRIGQKLGNYQLVRLLGEGGSAEVYLGEHIHLGTRAAIKILRTQLTADDVDIFRNEARTIAQLEHPYSVRVLDFGVEEKTPFLVMSYATNGTLRQRYPKGTRLPLAAVLPYITQVANALQYAHDEKVIHRDVKPENMLIGKRQEILLSDFGIAVMAQSSRYQNAQDMAGTITYMAPEQIQGKPRPASDQYSLGIVIYEWLSGNRPFHGSLTEMVGQHLSASPPPLREKLPTISPAVEEVVMKALAKDPKERFAKVGDLAIALEQASQSTQTGQSGVVVLSNDRLSTTPNEAVTPPNQRSTPDISRQIHKSKEEWLFDALKFLETDNYAKALTTLNTLLSLDPDLAYAHSAKGLSLYHLNHYSEALTSLDRAVALNLNETTAHFGRGLVLQKLKRFAEALLEYDQVTRFEATYASAWRQKGNILSEMKRYEESLTAYEKALQLNENDADAYIGKGNV
ncbi:MAG TPA: serine/threonine-protein kinase [Ktedonobacteraceae bacterium]